jgi:hypothetical protein
VADRPNHRRPGFFWAHNYVYDRYWRELGCIVMGVYCGLARHADNDGRTCFPSYARLGRELKLDRRTVQRAIDTLEANELISRERRLDDTGANSSNGFSILFHPSLAMGDVDEDAPPIVRPRSRQAVTSSPETDRPKPPEVAAQDRYPGCDGDTPPIGTGPIGVAAQDLHPMGTGPIGVAAQDLHPIGPGAPLYKEMNKTHVTRPSYNQTSGEREARPNPSEPPPSESSETVRISRIEDLKLTDDLLAWGLANCPRLAEEDLRDDFLNFQLYSGHPAGVTDWANQLRLWWRRQETRRKEAGAPVLTEMRGPATPVDRDAHLRREYESYLGDRETQNIQRRDVFGRPPLPVLDFNSWKEEQGHV